MKHAGLKLVLLLILLAALAAGGWMMFQHTGNPSPLRLPNGMVVRYLTTVVGSGAFSTEQRWEKMARRVLPRPWRSWLPSAVTGSTGGQGSNSVTVFWEVIDPSGTPINRPPWDDYRTADEDGFEFERGGGWSSWGGSLPGHQVYGLTLRALPRRQPSFDFQFISNNGVVIASVRLPNPTPGPFPKWTPQTLPITFTNDPVVLTLTGLAEAGNATYRSLRPSWQVTSSNPLWTNARPGFMEVEDPTGNVSYRLLSLREPAWKLRTWVHRRRPQDFIPAEKLVLTNLAVPAPVEFQELNVSEEIAGVKLRVRCFAGAGDLLITNRTSIGMVANGGRNTGWSTSSDGKTEVHRLGSATPFFLVEGQGAQPHDEVRFRVWDEQGREIKLEESTHGTGSGISQVWEYERKLVITNEVKTVSLEIIVSHPREFEFMINPAEIKRAAATTK